MSDSTRQEETILLFDGVCNLCHNAVRFIIPRDPHARIRFASLQSPAGQRFLDRYGLPVNEINTVVLIDAGRVYTKSDAVLRVVRKLRGWWPALSLLALLPGSWRDAAYDWVARNRYRWFGKREACLLPTPEIKARFLDHSDH